MKRIIIIVGLLSFLVGVGVFIPDFLKEEKIEVERKKLNDKERPRIKPGYDRPDLAMQQEFNMTMDPALGYPPVRRLVEGYKYATRMVSNQRFDSNQKATWVERGPNNFGGRTRAVMFDPNDKNSQKIWAAGVTGGLWYNTNITESSVKWQKVDDFLGTLNITTLAYDPTDTKRFYLGSGEGWYGSGSLRGNGIWTSEDGGITWEQLMSTDINDFAYVQKIIVTSTGTVLAATRGFNGPGGIFRSTDNGATWTEILNGPGADIEIVEDVIYVSKGIFSTGSLYRSTDDGVTLTEITPASNGERIEIGVSEGDKDVVYALASSNLDVSWFYRSDDRGDTWQELNIPLYLNSGDCNESSQDFARGQAWYDLIVGVHPTNSKVVIAGGIDSHRSVDGGITWEPISYWTGSCESMLHADQHNFIFRPGYPNQAISTNDGGVYYVKDITRAKEQGPSPSDNGGPVFEARNNGYNVAQFYACAALNEAGSNYFLAGSQDNGSHRFDQYGINSTEEATGGDGAFCFIDQNEGNIQITSYVFNSYFLFRDALSQIPGDDISFGAGEDFGLFINPADYSNDANTLFAAGNSGNYHRYVIEETGTPTNEEIDAGIGGQISALKVSDYDMSLMAIGTSGGSVYLVEGINGSDASATEITSDAMPAGYVSSVTFGSSNDQILVTFSNYGMVSLWETLDGGLSWQVKEGNLPDMPIRWSLYNPQDYDVVLVATDLGIWMTNDITADEPTWQPANIGLANVRCDMIEYRESDGLVIVATHGRGLYTSNIFVINDIADFYTDLSGVAFEKLPMNFFNASTFATDGATFSWDFGDGNTSTEVSPQHTYEESGTYTVSLVMNNDETLRKEMTIRVQPKRGNSYSLQDGGDFESNTDDFTAISTNGSALALGNSSVSGKNGTNSGDNCWVLAPDDESYTFYTEAYLYTPIFDFSISGVYSIEFYTKFAIEEEWDGFILESSIDGGNSWAKVGDYYDADDWYNSVAIDQNGIFDPGKPFFSGSSGISFERKFVDVSSLSGNENVIFRFTFKSDPFTEEAGVAIDDFQLSGPSETAVNLVVGSSSDSFCIDNIVTINNSSTGAVENYSWDFGADAVPATAEGYGPFEVTYTSSGTKSIVMTATTSSGDVSEQISLTVLDLPVDQDIADASVVICDGENTDIVIQNSQANVSYSLVEIGGENPIGEVKTGDGTQLTFNTGELNTGFYSLSVLATNSDGCSRALSDVVNIEVLMVEPLEISESDLELTASYRLGDGYQWFLNGDTISNATNDVYEVTASGSYSLAMLNNSCISYSNSIEIEDVLDFEALSLKSIYPNPFNTYVEIGESINLDDVRVIRVFDLSGTEMIRFDDNVLSRRLNMSNINTAGIYVMKIDFKDNQQLVLKVIKD